MRLQKLAKYLTIDTLIILFMLSVLINWFIHREDNIELLQYHNYLVCGLIYCSCRLSLDLSYKCVKSITLLLVIVLFVVQLLIGCYQIVNSIVLHNYNSILIYGSFNNSGSYAGFLSVCICILFPICYKGEKKEHKLLLYLIAISLFVIVITLCRTALLALVVFFLLFNRHENYIFISLKRIKYLIPIGLVLLVILFFIKQKSAIGRLYLYVIDLRALFENGLMGSGLGGFTSSFMMAQKSLFAPAIIESQGSFNISGLTYSVSNYADLFTEAFNDYLKIGIELGPLALILYLGILSCSIKALYLADISNCGGLVCMAVLSMLYFPLSILANKIIVFVIISFASYYQSRYVIKRFDVLKPVFLSLTVVTMVFCIPFYLKRAKAEKEYFDAYTIWYNRQKYPQFIEDTQPLFNMLKHNERFCYSLADAYYQLGDYPSSIMVINEGLKCCYSNELLQLLGENYERTNDIDKAEYCYKEAFRIIPNRIKPLWHLSKLYFETDQIEKLLSLSDQINHFKPKIESNLVLNYRKEVDFFVEQVGTKNCL